MGKKCIGYNDITKMFIYQDEETGLIYQDKGVLGVDKIEEIKTAFGINGTGDMFTKSKRCECCKVEFLLRDIKGDLCVNCYDFIEERQNDKISDLEAKLAEKQSRIQELNDMYEELLCAKGTENELIQVSADCDFFAKENRKLKQQLAEKDAEIEKLNKRIEKQVDNGYKIIQNCKEIQTQSIIERLNKVKEYCRQEAYHDSYGDYMIVYERRYYEDDEEKTPNDDLMGFLDNQIEELKKGVE